MTTTILGAGIAGLAAATYLRENGGSYAIFEAADHAGGLLAGFDVEGFRFDNAVHLSFATEPEVRAQFDKTPYLTHKPESLNWDNGKWLRHPVQNNLYPLETDEKIGLIKGLLDQPEAPIGNYRDWLIQQYGAAMAERWPLKYTRKYWRFDAEHLGTDWIGTRMRKADIAEVLRGAMEPETENTYYVKEMRYPVEGGYYSFIRPMVDESTIHYGHRVKRISLTSKTIWFENNQTMQFETIINTMPLPLIAEMIDEIPESLKQDASDLVATQIDLISVGFRKENVSPSLWFYIYDEDIEAARAYSPSWKSPRNAPEGCSSLQFEIYSYPGEPINRDPNYLIQNTRSAVISMGLAKEDEILFCHHKRLPYGNVIFKQGMETKRDRIIAWLEDNAILNAGRFGCWDYYWSNQAFMSGLNAAKNIISRR